MFLSEPYFLLSSSTLFVLLRAPEWKEVIPRNGGWDVGGAAIRVAVAEEVSLC